MGSTLQIHRTDNLLILIFYSVFLIILGCGQHQNPGHVEEKSTPFEHVLKRKSQQQRAVAALDLNTEEQKQILFGDLHVHSTFSPDAFATASPIIGGDGLRPPTAACDFARYCSALDFWSINDHAEGLTPQRWRETKQAVRECNAVASDGDPDLVTFLGWEWSQVSHYDRKQHYGHKNVIFLDTEEDRVPTRPIAAPRDQLGKSPMSRIAPYILALRDFANRDYYRSIQTFYDEMADIPPCQKDVHATALPDGCHETAADPATLFRKLREWGYEHMVIPHGNAWGLNTPPATSLDKQLTREQHSPDQQFLFELFSGHGNSEEYRDWRAVAFDSEGRAFCPEPGDSYEPCCWRAGKIIQERCTAEGLDTETCAQREYAARQHFVDAGVSGHLTVPGQTPDDWLNCGQCEDCFLPGMDHRPATTAQYALALSNTSEAGDPLRFNFGLIGSSDNHASRGGSGYKESQRLGMTETYGARDKKFAARMAGKKKPPIASSEAFALDSKVGLANKRNMERQSSFWFTGGLVAVHSEGRQREAIWRGLRNKEVYATSGDRILLWFNLLDGSSSQAMGSSLTTSHNPRFKVTAIGAFEQRPGCPAFTSNLLNKEQLEAMCLGECYHPSEKRKIIDRIEVVRIRPKLTPNEAIAPLIEDPWRSFTCEENEKGCQIEFEDPDYANAARDTLYYVRAIQRMTPTINAGGLRCARDAQGQCISVEPCYGDYRSDANDDCLAPSGERAWSSPIFLTYRDLDSSAK